MVEDSGHNITKCLQKLDKIEQSFRGRQTLMALFECGLLSGQNNVVLAGDFDLITWSHSSDGAFSVGVLEKNRNDGKPFPEHEHEQRVWLLCSKGVSIIEIAGVQDQKTLHQGEYVVIDSLIKHTIQAATKECVLLMVTIPADPGLNRSHEK